MLLTRPVSSRPLDDIDFEVTGMEMKREDEERLSSKINDNRSPLLLLTA